MTTSVHWKQQRLVFNISGSSICLRDRTGETGFSDYADLLGITAEPDPGCDQSLSPEVEVVSRMSFAALRTSDMRILFHSGIHSVVWDPDTAAFIAVLDKEYAPSALVRFWGAIMEEAFTAAVFRRKPLCPVHGALLETPDGKGILLSGESGIGKSTTARRWEEIGGRCFADDLILLDRDPDSGKFFASPMPTWSRCLVDCKGLQFPVTRRIPLAGVLVLDRAEPGTGERIEDIETPFFRAQLFRSLFYRLIVIARRMPEETFERMRDTVWRTAGDLAEQYPHLQLKAALDGDLRKTLERFL